MFLLYPFPLPVFGSFSLPPIGNCIESLIGTKYVRYRLSSSAELTSHV
jgi:hypothetical protein